MKSIFTHLFGSKQIHLSTPFSEAIIQNIKVRNTTFTIKYDATNAGQLEQEIEEAMASLQTTSPYCYHNFSQYRYVYTEYDTHITMDFHMTFKTNNAEEAYVQTKRSPYSVHTLLLD